MVVVAVRLKGKEGVMAASLATAFSPRANVCPLISYFNLTVCFVVRCSQSPPRRICSTAALTLPGLPLEALEDFGRRRGALPPLSATFRCYSLIARSAAKLC